MQQLKFWTGCNLTWGRCAKQSTRGNAVITTWRQNWLEGWGKGGLAAWTLGIQGRRPRGAGAWPKNSSLNVEPGGNNRLWREGGVHAKQGQTFLACGSRSRRWACHAMRGAGAPYLGFSLPTGQCGGEGTQWGKSTSVQECQLGGGWWVWYNRAKRWGASQMSGSQMQYKMWHGSAPAAPPRRVVRGRPHSSREGIPQPAMKWEGSGGNCKRGEGVSAGVGRRKVGGQTECTQKRRGCGGAGCACAAPHQKSAPALGGTRGRSAGPLNPPLFLFFISNQDVPPRRPWGFPSAAPAGMRQRATGQPIKTLSWRPTKAIKPARVQRPAVAVHATYVESSSDPSPARGEAAGEAGPPHQVPSARKRSHCGGPWEAPRSMYAAASQHRQPALERTGRRGATTAQ